MWVSTAIGAAQRQPMGHRAFRPFRRSRVRAWCALSTHRIRHRRVAWPYPAARSSRANRGLAKRTVATPAGKHDPRPGDDRGRVRSDRPLPLGSYALLRTYAIAAAEPLPPSGQTVFGLHCTRPLLQRRKSGGRNGSERRAITDRPTTGSAWVRIRRWTAPAGYTRQRGRPCPAIGRSSSVDRKRSGSCASDHLR